MDYIAVVEVVNSFENLFDSLRSIPFRELALVTNPVEKLSTCS